MRIGVDVTAFRSIRAGVARYLQNMLAHMMVVAPETEFVLYASRSVTPPLPDGNWRLRTGSGLSSRVGSLWVQRVLPKWLAEDRVDAFWGQNQSVPFGLKRVCFRAATVHDFVPMLYPQTMKLRARLSTRFLFPRALRAADRLIAVSQFTARLAEVHASVRPEKIRVVYEGIEGEFKPVAKAAARGQLVSKFGLTSPYLLVVSTIEPRKDHATLLRALELIPDAPLLVIVGAPGWKCRPVINRVRVLERHGRVRYLGRVEDCDLPALYSAAVLTVYPSLYEGFGLPVLEAMACGCPVLCSCSSSLPEVGGNAVAYFRTHELADLVVKLRELLAGGEALERMAADGLVQARRFSFRKAAAEVLDLMNEGVNTMRRRGFSGSAVVAAAPDQLARLGHPDHR